MLTKGREWLVWLVPARQKSYYNLYTCNISIQPIHNPYCSAWWWFPRADVPLVYSRLSAAARGPADVRCCFMLLASDLCKINCSMFTYYDVLVLASCRRWWRKTITMFAYLVCHCARQLPEVTRQPLLRDEQPGDGVLPLSHAVGFSGMEIIGINMEDQKQCSMMRWSMIDGADGSNVAMTWLAVGWEK
jgi:hypothetical protein